VTLGFPVDIGTVFVRSDASVRVRETTRSTGPEPVFGPGHA